MTDTIKPAFGHVEFSYGGPPAVNIEVQLIKYARTKCSRCGKRRILFALGIPNAVVGPTLCAVCSGIRG